jgi:hypothetical protein
MKSMYGFTAMLLSALAAAPLLAQTTTTPVRVCAHRARQHGNGGSDRRQHGGELELRNRGVVYGIDLVLQRKRRGNRKRHAVYRHVRTNRDGASSVR